MSFVYKLIIFGLWAQFDLTNQFTGPELTEEELLCIRNAEEYTLNVSTCRENPDIYDIIDENILTNLNQMNEDDLRATISETCTLLEIELECDIIEYNQIVLCDTLKYMADLRISMTIDKVLTEFLCENNGIRVMNLIPNEGLQLIFDNDIYNSCVERLDEPDLERVTNKENDYFISEEYCLYLENVYQCLKQYLNSAKNEYIRKYELELHKRLMRQLNCNSFFKTV